MAIPHKKRLQTYVSALENYLDGGGEEALDRAYEIGRAAVQDRLGVLEVTSLHQDALEVILKERPSRERGIRRVKMASSFLNEALAPFEMTQRGYQETLMQLQSLNQNLEEQVAERTASLRAEIVERQRAEETLKRRLSELEAVAEVTNALRSPQTLDGMLSLLMDTISSALKTDMCAVWLRNVLTNEFYVAASHGLDDLLSAKLNESPAALVLTLDDEFVSREFKTDGRVPNELRPLLPPELGGANVPVVVAKEVIGILSVAVHLPREIEPDEVRLLRTVADIAGTAIHRMRLYEQTERRLRQITALRHIDQAITSSLDLGLTLDILLAQVMDQLWVDAAAVLLLNRSNILEFAAGRGFRSQSIQASRLRLGEGYAGRAALERQVIDISNLSVAQPEFTRAFLLAGEDFVSYYAVPLVAKGQVKGILEIFHRSLLRPDREWLSFLEALAGQAAIAVDNAALFNDLQRSNVELVLAYDATIEGWSRALDLRDKETEGHTQRVTEMTVKLANAAGFSDDEIIQVRRGALLHDIGKMGIPDSILLKPGKLTEREWEIMRKHPVYAYEMLHPVQYLRPAVDIPYCHHEKWNGSGYPRGLQGEQIPLSARLFAVVDVWDALTSERPYRKAWSAEKALAYIRSESGSYFDPEAVELFLKMLGSSKAP